MIATLFNWLIFLFAAGLATFSALMMVTRRSPIHSALWLIVTFFSLAVIYLTLNAQFIAVAQVIVYAGAIMMLIIFVIMLIHLERPADETRKSSSAKVVGGFITVILFLEVAAGVLSFQMTGKKGPYTAEMVNQAGNVKTVGTVLYGQYLFPFEIASVLLLIGIIGAVVLSKRGKE